MKKTISVNISGFVFNIEEDAYEQLQQYLNSIRKNFTAEEDCDEIMDDIESRIAELFHDKITGNKEVITDKDVQDIMDIMGQPKDYVTEESENAEQESSSKQEQTTGSARRLFRDEENASVGGVCAGLGHFFSVDPVAIRIAFILMVLLGGSGVLVYLIMWIVVPKAETTADKMAMKGQTINLDNIRDHVQKVKEDLKDKTKRGQTREKVKSAVDRGIRASSTAFKAFAKFIGLAFTLGGIFCLLAIGIILFGHNGFLPMSGTGDVESFNTLLEVVYPSSFKSTITFIALIIGALIPIGGIIYTGIKLLFDIRKNNRIVTMSCLIVWLVAVGTLTITGIDLGMNFRDYSEVQEEVIMENDSTDILYIDVAKDDMFSDHIEFNSVWYPMEMIRVDEQNIYLGFPKIKVIEKYDSTDFEIRVVKQSNGRSKNDAIAKATNIQYNVTLNDNHLVIPPYYYYDKNDKVRNQRPTVEVFVPLGKKVKFGDKIDRVEVQMYDEYAFCYERFSNMEFQAQLDGFQCSECSTSRIKGHWDHDHYNPNF